MFFYTPTIIRDPEDIINVASSYITKEEDLNKIRKAIKYVEEKFSHIKRKNGDPYVYHLYTAAYLVANWNVSPTSIIAALLHDLIEDIEGETKESVEKEFGKEVAFIVEKLTKIRKFEKAHYIDIMGAYMRQIILGMAQDVRVMIIKMADRYNNIETLNFLREEKQILYAKETSEVYVPIAKALGFHDWASYIDNLCFFYYDREKFMKTKKIVDELVYDKKNNINDVVSNIEQTLEKGNIDFVDIKGRKKTHKSIANKLLKKESIYDIYDLFAIRILCKSITDCYLVLGIIHQNYNIILKRFKDYISKPKGNMYQSLHTTIVLGNHDVEVQIRTPEMDDVAENGIAAHWKYKEGSYSHKSQQEEILDKIHILKRIIKYDESNEGVEQSQGEWWEKLQKEILGKKIICLTPKNNIIELRKDSSALDFAFAIHTEVGLTAVRAIVDGKFVPLKTKLKSGNIVEIKTQRERNVSQKWLEWTVSETAKNRIKKALKERENKIEKIENDSKIISGENILKNYLKANNLLDKYKENYKEIVEFLLEKMDKDKVESVFVELNKNRSILSDLFTFIFGKLSKEEKLATTKKSVKTSKLKGSEVNVEGVTGIKTKLAKCCNPIYGEEIVASTSQKSGLLIHRKNCNVLKITFKPENLFEASWGRKGNEKFRAKLYIKAINHINTINLILTSISSSNIEVKSFTSKFNESDAKIAMTFIVSISSIESLNLLLTKIKELSDVIEVSHLN